jgi:uncharacterized membrane protein
MHGIRLAILYSKRNFESPVLLKFIRMFDLATFGISKLVRRSNQTFRNRRIARSTMPPLHPALVHFPIALVVFSFVTDLLGRLLNKPSLRAAGFWSLIGALVTGAVAAAAGYYDFSRAALGETAAYVDFHMDIGWILVGCVVGLTAWRWLVYVRRDTPPGLPYLIAAFLLVGLTLFQGWYGGEMVYSQGAGVAAAGKGTEPATAGKQRLDKVTK